MDKKQTVLAAAMAASAATMLAPTEAVGAGATAQGQLILRQRAASQADAAASAPKTVECKVNPDTGRNLMTLQGGGLSRLSVADVAKAKPCVVVAPASAPAPAKN